MHKKVVYRRFQRVSSIPAGGCLMFWEKPRPSSLAEAHGTSQDLQPQGDLEASAVAT